MKKRRSSISAIIKAKACSYIPRVFAVLRHDHIFLDGGPRDRPQGSVCVAAPQLRVAAECFGPRLFDDHGPDLASGWLAEEKILFLSLPEKVIVHGDVSPPSVDAEPD